MAKRVQNDLDFEIEFYERILQRKPDFIEALIVIGDLYTRKGLYEKGLEVDRKLSELRPDDGTILYNLACSYSLINKIDQAFSTIRMAIECGYNNLSYLEKDRDLENLRLDNRFSKFLASVKKKESRC